MSNNDAGDLHLGSLTIDELHDQIRPMLSECCRAEMTINDDRDFCCKSCGKLVRATCGNPYQKQDDDDAAWNARVMKELCRREQAAKTLIADIPTII